MNLEMLGWNNRFEESFQPYLLRDLVPGRVIREARHSYTVVYEGGEIEAEISGHFRYTAIDRSDYPVSGDWVALRVAEGMGIIEGLLPRQSLFSRSAAGIETSQQVIAANVDYLCIVSGLDGGRNFTLRGIERYLTLAHSGGVKPVIVLNKADLCSDREGAMLNARSVCGGAPVFFVSALTGEGVPSLGDLFLPGQTVAFAGPSGVGKSALTNALLGETVQKTGRQREDDKKGRHTTTHRELFSLSGGAMIIDTPGLRELGLWGDADGLNDTFAEIHEAAAACRFADCTHTGEPGCAVQRALTEGRIDPDRYNSYLDMQAELETLERRRSQKGRLEEKRQDKRLSKIIRNYYRTQGGE